MTLPRKDLRVYFEPEDHARLARLCARDDIELTAFIEREIVAIVDREFHRAEKLLNVEPDCHGLSRSGPAVGEPAPRDLPFAPRKPL